MVGWLASVQLLPLRGSRLWSTQFDVIPAALMVSALVLYLWGVKRANEIRPRHPWPTGRTVAFVGALVSTGLSLFSFVGAYDGVLFWDHMVQHLLLIMVAAPLFAIGSPIALAWRSTTGIAHLSVTDVLRSRVAKIAGHPALAFCLYAVVIPLTHLTSWYNYTLVHEPVHNAEHLVFLFVGYLFWRQVFGIDPNRYRMSPPLQFAYLFLAIPIDTFTGLSLDQARHELFPAYLSLHRSWGPSLVNDLHLGGVIMWVGGDTLMLWPMIPVALRWLHLEERRAIRMDQLHDEAESQLTLAQAAKAALD